MANLHAWVGRHHDLKLRLHGRFRRQRFPEGALAVFSCAASHQEMTLTRQTLRFWRSARNPWESAIRWATLPPTGCGRQACGHPEEPKPNLPEGRLTGDRGFKPRSCPVWGWQITPPAPADRLIQRLARVEPRPTRRSSDPCSDEFAERMENQGGLRVAKSCQ